MTVLPEASSAVTLTVIGVPVMAEEGAETTSVEAETVTVMVALVPVIELFTVSVAVMVWVPAISKVTENVPTPLVRVELEGKTAWLSVEVK